MCSLLFSCRLKDSDPYISNGVSGSGRPKNIRIRIHNTSYHSLSPEFICVCSFFTCPECNFFSRTCLIPVLQSLRCLLDQFFSSSRMSSDHSLGGGGEVISRRVQLKQQRLLVYFIASVKRSLDAYIVKPGFCFSTGNDSKKIPPDFRTCSPSRKATRYS
jgi:hypothetical protein